MQSYYSTTKLGYLKLMNIKEENNFKRSTKLVATAKNGFRGFAYIGKGQSREAAETSIEWQYKEFLKSGRVKLCL